MSLSTKDLVDRGRFLRNAAPREFDGFYQAFEKYAETVVYGVLSADGEQELLRVQGHAQQCVKILQVLEEIKNG